MKNILLILCFVFSMGIHAQSKSTDYLEIVAYQKKANEEFLNPETTILTTEDLKEFKALEFYPINIKYIVVANFIRTPNEKPFLMPTTTDRLPEYVKYGEAHFQIDSEQLSLNVYQSVPPSTDPEFVDYLFLPFTDLTSGDGSYGGGRFIDARIPDGNTILIDFNRAYNPYCAYNNRYSCPIPPSDNDLDVRIEAGIKDFGEHH